MAAKNNSPKQVKPVAPPTPTPAPVAPTAAEVYKANVARQAETHAVITQRPAPFCLRAGIGTRAWALDLALCDLHAAGQPINVQSMLAAADKRLESVKSPIKATPGSHFAAMIQRGYLARGANGYVLTEHGIKQAEACGVIKPAPTARSKPKGKK